MNGGYHHGGNDAQGWIYYDNSGNNMFPQQPQQQQIYLQNVSMQPQFPMHQIPPGLTFNQGGVYQGPPNSYPHINFMQSQVAVNSAMTAAHMMGGGSCCSGYATGGSQHLSQSSGFLTQGSSHLSQSSGPLQNSLASGSSQQKAKGFRYGTEEKVIGSEDDRTSSGSGTEEGLIEHLELSKFKCQLCPNQSIQHNHKQCQFYHGLKDRRRVGVTYSSDQCQFIDSLGANCPLGDRCPKSHNKVEQLYCVDKYKTKFCTHYPNDCRSCEYGEFCSFAHSESDINAELIHNYEFDADFYVFRYKTVWCPFNYINHDRGICVYAHNWQDYRRKPNSSETPYEPESCSSWEPNSFITDYELGCPNKQSCNKCHGWKELEYHPKIYRTKPCMQQQCPKAKACPFYHNQAEKRILSMNIQSELFRYAPKNRITKGLFKTSQSVIPREIKQQQQQQQQQGSASMNSSAANQSKQGLFSSTSSQPSSGSYGQMQSDGNHGSIGVSVGSSQFRKQNSLNQKKGRVNSALTKLSTCHDLSSKLVEEFSSADINGSKGKGAGEEEEKKEMSLSTVHSPTLKKPMLSSSTGGTNRIQFKRCESQSIDDNSSDESETPKQDLVPLQQQPSTSLQTLDSTNNASNENQQGGLRKSIKITSPFVLEGEAETSLAKIKQPTQTTTLLSNDQGFSPSIQLSSKEEDTEREDESQQDKPHSPYNQFDNAFAQPIQHQLPSQNNEMQIPKSFNQLGGHEHSDLQNQNQQQTPISFDSIQQLTKKPNIIIQSKARLQQNNAGNSDHQHSTPQNPQNLSKTYNHNQDEDDFNHINSLIDNIL